MKKIIIIITLLLCSIMIALSVIGLFKNNDNNDNNSISTNYNRMIITSFGDDLHGYVDTPGQEKKIETNRLMDDTIVENKEFASCEGELTISMDEDQNYKLDMNSSCSNDGSTSRDTAIVKYENIHANLDGVFNLGDSLVICASGGNKISINYLYKDGIIKWSNDIEEPVKENYSYISTVSDVKMINNNIYVFVSYEKYSEIDKYDFGRYEELYIYNKNGELISSEKMVLSDEPVHIESIVYLGSWNNKYYYVADGNSAYLTNNVLEVDENGYKLTSKSNDSNIDNDVISYYSFDSGIIDGKIYSVDDWGEETILYKSDLTGKAEKEIVLFDETDDSYSGILVTSNYIYVSSYIEETDEIKLDKYDKNLKLIKKNINYNKVKNKENLSTYEYIINDNKLVFTYGLRDDNFIEYMVYYDEKYNYLYSDYVTRFFIGSYPSYYGLLGDYVVSINDMDYYTITDGGSVNFTDNNVHIALIKYLNEEK